MDGKVINMKPKIVKVFIRKTKFDGCVLQKSWTKSWPNGEYSKFYWVLRLSESWIMGYQFGSVIRL